MGIIYWLFNLFIPLLLLTYTSITTFNQSNTISYSKWALMIIIIYLMSWISWLFHNYYSIYFIDLAIKLVIPFLPQRITIKIQQSISNLHLETHFDQLRQYLIHLISLIYLKITDYLLSKMNQPQTQQFKSTLIDHLNTNIKESKNTTLYNKISYPKNYHDNIPKSSAKTNVNYWSSHKEQTPNDNQFKLQQKQKEATSKQLISKQFIEKPYKQLVSKEFIDKQYQLQQHIDKDQEQFPRFSYSSKNNRIVNETAFENINYQTPVQQIRSEYKNQSVDLRYERIPVQGNRFFKSQTKSIFTQLSSPTNQYQPPYNQYQSPYKQYQRPHKQYQPQYGPYSQYQPTRSQLSRHLESATHQQLGSQYPDMFASEARQEKQRVLECRVQVILQIGSGSSARLQIYYLELYSNRDLRIVSLYEREFQSHRLHSMKALPHGYYELVFEGGKIRSRKCKFRQGNPQPFLKYLN